MDAQTTHAEDPHALAELTAQIVSAYVANNALSATDLPKVIKDVHAALTGIGTQSPAEAAPAELKPAVPIRRSVQADHIVCLEDGKKFKSLKRHLMTHFSMTPDQYRAKWGLPPDYPMVAPSYSATRSSLAKSSGLGVNRSRANGAAAH